MWLDWEKTKAEDNDNNNKGAKRKADVNSGTPAVANKRNGENHQDMAPNDTVAPLGAQKNNHRTKAETMKQHLTEKKKHVPSSPFDNIELDIQLLMDELDWPCLQSGIDCFLSITRAQRETHFSANQVAWQSLQTEATFTVST